MPTKPKKKTFLPQQPARLLQPAIKTFAPLPPGPQEGLASERAYEQAYAATLPPPAAPPQQFAPLQQPTPAPDYLGGIKDVGKLIYDIPAQFTGAAGRLLEDKYPGERETIADTMRAYGRERTKQRAGELTPEQRASPVLPFKLPFMDKKITRGDIADTSSSTGFSGMAMGAGLLGGAAGLLASAPEGGLPAPVTVPAGAMAASGAAAYKMDRVAATEQLIDFFAEAKGSPLTIDEQGALIDAHDSELMSHAAWEAGPEALSNVFGVIPGLKNIAKGVTKAGLGKLAKGLATMYGSELATETITQMGQQRAESRMGISGEPERDWSDPAAWKKSFQEVAPQTMILSTGMGGAGAVTGATRKALLSPPGPTQRAAEGAQPAQPAQPDQAPGVTIEPEGFSAQLQADTVDAFDQARFAAEQGQIQPGTPEFQAVKESIQEIQQRNIPEEQEALKQNQDVVDFFTKEQQPPPSTVESAMQQGAQAAGVEPILDEVLARPAPALVAEPAQITEQPQKEIYTQYGKGKIVGYPFGRITVELPDGSRKTVAKEDTSTTPQQVKEHPEAVRGRLEQIQVDHKEKLDRYKRSLAAGALNQQEYDSRVKGLGAITAKAKREAIQEEATTSIQGGLTPRELEQRIRKERSNYEGKLVDTPAGKGKIYSNPFGKVRVRLDTGELKTFEKNQVSATPVKQSKPGKTKASVPTIEDPQKIAIELMKRDMAEGEAGYRFRKEAPVEAGYDPDSGKFEGVKSTNPEWMKQDKILQKVGKVRINRVLELSEQGKKLTPIQTDIKARLDKAADWVAENDPGMVAGKEADTLQEEGFALGQKETIPVGNLSPGDEVVIADEQGMPDKLTHKGFDKEGNAILQDGKRMIVDPFEQIETIGKKIKADPGLREDVTDFVTRINENTNLDNVQEMIREIPEATKGKLAPYREMLQGTLDRRVVELGGKVETQPAGKEPSEAFPTKRSVEDALRKGEMVPAEIMAKYPELSKAKPEDISKKKATKRLGSKVIAPEGTVEDVRRTLGQYSKTPKQFQEERRDTEKLQTITSNPDYAKVLPRNAEKILSEAADIAQELNNINESLKINKEHLVKLLDKAGVEEVATEFQGREYTLKKPTVTGGNVELNRAGQDVREEILKDFEDQEKLKYLTRQGRTLSIQTMATPESKAGKYGTKTLDKAATEHLEFLSEKEKLTEQKAAVKEQIFTHIVDNLVNKGLDHVWRDQGKKASFTIKRGQSKKFSIDPADAGRFEELRDQLQVAENTKNEKDIERIGEKLNALVSQETKEEIAAKEKALKEQTELTKLSKTGLGSAGVSPSAAMGIKGKGSKKKREAFKARVQAEIAERVKLSAAAGVLSRADQADILGELTESLGQGVIDRLQRDKAFELVSNEQALAAVKKDAEIEIKYSKYGQRIEGLTFPDGRVWLVKENIGKGQALTVLTHELGVHARKLGFKDSEPFNRILKRLESLLEAGTDKDINAAFAKVPDSTPADQVTEEGLARLASMSPEHGLIRRLFAAIKQFLINKRFFPEYLTGKLTTADLQVMAQIAVRADIKPKKQETDTKVKFSLADLPTTPEATQQRLNNTENLNATAPDGTTSGATPEQGKSYMAGVSKAINEAVGKVAAEKQAAIQKERKLIGAYHALRNVARSPVSSLKKKKESLEAFRDLIPEELQIDLNRALKILSDTEKGFDQQKQAFEKVKDTLLEATKADLNKAIRSNQLPRVKPELRRGKRGKDLKADMALIRKAKQMDRGEVVNRQEALDKQVEKLSEIIGNPQASKTAVATAEAKLADAYSEKQLLNVFGDFGKLSYGEILRAKEAVNDLVTHGTGAWRAIQDQRNAINNKNALMVRQEVQGKQDPKEYSPAEMSQVAEKEKTAAYRAKKLVTDVENSNMIFGFYLDKIAGKSGKGMLQSDTVKLFEGIASWATGHEEQLKLALVEGTIRTKAAEIFGSGKSLKTAMGRMAEVSTDKVFSYTKTGQKKEPFHINPGQAIYLRQLSNFDEAQSGLDAMGVTVETLQDIENFLSPEEKQWGDWQQQEFYPKLQADTGKVVQNVEGINILNSPNEVPLHRETGGLDIGVQRTKQAGLKHGSSSEIEKENQPFRLMDADQVMMGYMKAMAHYQAWAGPMGIITGTFNNPQVQASVIAEYGQNTMDGLKIFFRDMAKVPNGTDSPWADKARANVTTALLGGSLITPVKQLVSIPAMAADIPTAAFAKNFIYGATHPGKVRHFVKNWDFIDRRMKMGFERDMKIAKTKQTKAVIAGSKNIADWMMSPISYGDAAGVVGGSFPVFKYYVDQGKTPEEAYFLTEKAARRTQQDSAIYNQTNFQRGGSLKKLFTMFLSSNILYTNQLQASFRALLTDPKKNYRSASKRIALFGVILPGIFTVIGAGGLGAWHGDDEDDEKLKETLLRDIALSGPKGMPIIGQFSEGVWNSMMGYYYGKNPTYSPVTEIGVSLSDVIIDGQQFILEDQDGEALLALADSVAVLTSYGTGIGYKPVKRTLEGWYDATTGQTDHPVLAAWGMSRYARGEK